MYLLIGLCIIIFVVIWQKMSVKKPTIIISPEKPQLSFDEYRLFLAQIFGGVLPFVLNSQCKILGQDRFTFTCKFNTYILYVDRLNLINNVFVLNYLMHKNGDFGKMDIELVRDNKILYLIENVTVDKVFLFISKDTKREPTYSLWGSNGFVYDGQNYNFDFSTRSTTPSNLTPLFCQTNANGTHVYDW